MSLIFRWCSRKLSSVRKTTAEAKGLCDILIWSVMSDAQHDVGYVRFGFTEKSWRFDEGKAEKMGVKRAEGRINRLTTLLLRCDENNAKLFIG